ncbi:ParA family protein [Motilimonas pumila]|uniref:ParA family protein n=1 Tax=Motilimonas pumila TaxID=2303987 RepID=A0A418YA39_9GAMM|nr:ParA family protein [Motilimonas pumila]RJG38989.1 ParA family protein [Motilimonas pumila]
MKKIMVGNRKGGVTKTTTTVNTAYEISKLGHKVLLVDFDSQGDTTKFTKRVDTEYYIGDVLMDRKFDINAAIYPAIINDEEQPNLHVIPARSGDIMTKLDMEMISLPRREDRLMYQLKQVEDRYDFVIMDTNPSTSVLGLNAVMAADLYIFPTEYKEHSLDGIDVLLEHICNVKYVEPDDVDFIILPTKIDKRAKRSLEFGESFLATAWPNHIADSVIYDRAVFSDSESEHEPISVISPGHVAANYYKKFAKEVVNHV